MGKYRQQIKSICFLAWPAVVQEAMNVVVTYVDTAMVGALGAGASAAVGLTSTVGWLVSSIAVAFGIGILSVCAQAVGANNDEKAGRAASSIFDINCWDSFNYNVCFNCTIFTNLAKW